MKNIIYNNVFAKLIIENVELTINLKSYFVFYLLLIIYKN